VQLTILLELGLHTLGIMTIMQLIGKTVRGISSAQMLDPPPVKILHFNQWDPGKNLLSLDKVSLILDTTLDHNLEDKVML
jgi:hypothetical protein